MFTPTTERIEKIAGFFPHVARHLDATIADRATSVYIDYANVRGWSDKLGWHVDLKRFRQLFDSFSGVKTLRFYYGLLDGNPESAQLINDARVMGYSVVTKPVKRIKMSIDISSISLDSADILRHLIPRPLRETLTTATIQHLNGHLLDLNKRGILFLEDLKCNFDVEIGRDMLVDHMVNRVDNYFLWSGDSDFADTVKRLLADRRKVVVFGTARKIARELNDLRSSGLEIFEVRRLREFLCWVRELEPKFK